MKSDLPCILATTRINDELVVEGIPSRLSLFQADGHFVRLLNMMALDEQIVRAHVVGPELLCIERRNLEP